MKKIKDNISILLLILFFSIILTLLIDNKNNFIYYVVFIVGMFSYLSAQSNNLDLYNLGLGSTRRKIVLSFIKTLFFIIIYSLIIVIINAIIMRHTLDILKIIYWYLIAISLGIITMFINCWQTLIKIIIICCYILGIVLMQLLRDGYLYSIIILCIINVVLFFLTLYIYKNKKIKFY